MALVLAIYRDQNGGHGFRDGRILYRPSVKPAHSCGLNERNDNLTSVLPVSADEDVAVNLPLAMQMMRSDILKGAHNLYIFSKKRLRRLPGASFGR